MAEPQPITFNTPSKYASNASGPAIASPPPPTDWLMGTWTVTHSTLAMWRTARNVRISYKPMPAKADGRTQIDDLVEYEPSGKTGVLKTVEGVDTQAADGGWDWRGKGWLFFVGSHWELLGSGEGTTPAGEPEKWAVTWFAPTVFTKEGLDIYCDRKEGLSEETYKKVDEALRRMEVKELVDMTTRDMKPVEIKLPWTEK